jgi:hypothetical protein
LRFHQDPLETLIDSPHGRLTENSPLWLQNTKPVVLVEKLPRHFVGRRTGHHVERDTHTVSLSDGL